MGEAFSGADPQALRLGAGRVALVARDAAALGRLLAHTALEAPREAAPLGEAVELLAARCGGALDGVSERLSHQASALRSTAGATEDATGPAGAGWRP